MTPPTNAKHWRQAWQVPHVPLALVLVVVAACRGDSRAGTRTQPPPATRQVLWRAGQAGSAPLGWRWPTGLVLDLVSSEYVEEDDPDGGQAATGTMVHRRGQLVVESAEPGPVWHVRVASPAVSLHPDAAHTGPQIAELLQAARYTVQLADGALDVVVSTEPPGAALVDAYHVGMVLQAMLPALPGREVAAGEQWTSTARVHARDEGGVVLFVHQTAAMAGTLPCGPRDRQRCSVVEVNLTLEQTGVVETDAGLVRVNGQGQGVARLTLDPGGAYPLESMLKLEMTSRVRGISAEARDVVVRQTRTILASVTARSETR